MQTSALVLIDYENAAKHIQEGRFIPEKFRGNVFAINRLFTWIRSEVDNIFDTFLFSPLHIVYTDYQLIHDIGLVPTTCPKVPLGSPFRKDTVDPILIEKGLKWITHPALTHLCLVSGDGDFIPLVKAAKKRGLKIMLSALDPSFARVPGRTFLSKDLAKLADISPKTGESMIHFFSPMA